MFQEGILLRNAKLDAINANLGATATAKIFSGAEPVDCAAPDPTGELVAFALPATVFNLSAAGVITISAAWTAIAAANGIAASFRVYDSSGNCAFQGNCTTDLVLNSTAIIIGKTVIIASFTLTAP